VADHSGEACEAWAADHSGADGAGAADHGGAADLAADSTASACADGKDGSNLAVG
jgi:hypothetical protein